MKTRNEVHFNVIINGNPVQVENCYRELLGVFIADSKENVGIFEILSLSPIEEDRESIAGKRSLNSNIVENLIDDECFSVRDTLLNNIHAYRHVTQDQIVRIITSGVTKHIESIARHHDNLVNCDIYEIKLLLSQYEETKIRQALVLGDALQYPKSKNILKHLTNDADPEVAVAAKEALEKVMYEFRLDEPKKYTITGSMAKIVCCQLREYSEGSNEYLEDAMGFNNSHGRNNESPFRFLVDERDIATNDEDSLQKLIDAKALSNDTHVL